MESAPRTEDSPTRGRTNEQQDRRERRLQARGDRAACGRGRAGARDRGAVRPQSPACVSLGPLQRAVSVGWCGDCTEEDEGETETNENASQRPCYEGRETPMTKKRTKGRGQVLVFFVSVEDLRKLIGKCGVSKERKVQNTGKRGGLAGASSCDDRRLLAPGTSSAAVAAIRGEFLVTAGCGRGWRAPSALQAA